MTRLRSYSELRRLDTFEERFRYLSLDGAVGRSTFGFDRYLNQRLYTSREWRQARNYIIVRDSGCDLGVLGYDIHDRILIHHMNPITVEDIVHNEDFLFDPDNLITTTHRTHNAIHYGDERQLVQPHVERSRGDTTPWRSNGRY